MIQYDPWNESHKPQQFSREDKTGRWIPIHDEYGESHTLAIAGGVIVGVLGAWVLYLWCTI